MKHIVSIALLVLMPLLLYAEEHSYKYTIPNSSPLTPIQCFFGGPAVCFSGKVVVNANYKFIYDYEGSTGLPDNPHLLIFPDISTLEMLPYLTERSSSEKPFEIMIHNPEEVALMLFGTELAAKISQGDYSEVSGKAEFELNGFGASYECDSAFFWSNITAIKRIILSHKLAKPIK